MFNFDLSISWSTRSFTGKVFRMKILIWLALIGLSAPAPQEHRGNYQDPQQRQQRQQPPLTSRRPPDYQRTGGEPLKILRFDNVNNGDGSYKFGYDTENGISVAEEGVVRAHRGGEADLITAVKGFFQYFAPEGQQLRVDYTADEDGFVPKGEHLPTPPPIPEAIMKSLAILYANAEKQKQLERKEPNRRF